MAVSLGQAALAFAGGAAKQFNANVEKEQKLKDDRTRRLQEMEEKAITAQTETEHSARFNEWHENQSFLRSVEAVGPNTGAGQAMLAKRYGLSWDEVRATGSMGKLPLPTSAEQPIPLTEAQKKLFGSNYDQGMVKYASKRDLSDKVDSQGRVIPKGLISREDGSLDPLDVLESAGITGDMPADVLADMSKMSPEEASQMVDLLAGNKKTITYDKEKGGFAVINETTQEASFVPAGEASDKPIVTYDKDLGGHVQFFPKTGESKFYPAVGIDKSGFTPTSTKGEEVLDLDTLRNLAEEDPERWGPIANDMEQQLKGKSNTILQKGTITEGDRSYDAVQAFNLDPVEGATPIGQAHKVGIQDGQSGAPDSRAVQAMADIEYSNRKVTEVQDMLVQRIGTVSAGQEGAAALITKTKDFLVGNIAGLAELAGVPRETGMDQLRALYYEADTDMDAVIADLRKNNSYLIGIADEQVGMLGYAMANTLKDIGQSKLTTKFDIEQAQTMISSLNSKERGTGAFATLMHRFDYRKAQNNQQIYMDQRASVDQKARAGKQLIALANPNLGDQLTTDRNGHVYIFTSEAHKQEFLSEVDTQGLGNKSAEYILNQFPEELRPMRLDRYIDEYTDTGWLTPKYDQKRYLEPFVR